MRSNRFFFPLSLAALLAMAACSSKSDLNQENMTAAIAKHLNDAPPHCIRNGDWPMVTALDPNDSMSVVREGRALESIGFVTESTAAVPRGYVAFSLTDEGKKHLTLQEIQPTPKEFITGGFCYGRLVLNKVTGWEAPIKVADYEGTKVSYTYTVTDVPDWAKRPELQKAFPLLASDLQGDGQGKWVVQLEAGQWRPKPM